MNGLNNLTEVEVKKTKGDMRKTNYQVLILL